MRRTSWRTISLRSGWSRGVARTSRDRLDHIAQRLHENAHAEPAGPELHPVVAPIGRSTSEDIHIPGPAPEHAPGLGRLTLHPGGADRRRTRIVGVPDVLAPLPHVTDQVEKPPGIRALETDRVGALAAIQLVPGTLVDASFVVAEEVLAGRTRSAGILPLRLGGQADSTPGQS